MRGSRQRKSTREGFWGDWRLFGGYVWKSFPCKNPMKNIEKTRKNQKKPEKPRKNNFSLFFCRFSLFWPPNKLIPLVCPEKPMPCWWCSAQWTRSHGTCASLSALKIRGSGWSPPPMGFSIGILITGESYGGGGTQDTDLNKGVIWRILAEFLRWRNRGGGGGGGVRGTPTP